jgi:hypothetical protein
MPSIKQVRPSGSWAAGRKIALSLLLLVLLAGGYWFLRTRTTEPTRAAASMQSRPVAATVSVPPYFESADAARPLPVTQDPQAFVEPMVRHAYRVAQKLPSVVAQQPCYCHCDRFGHRSLLDCYASDHGAG